MRSVLAKECIMAAYLIADVDVFDAEAFEEYKWDVSATE